MISRVHSSILQGTRLRQLASAFVRPRRTTADKTAWLVGLEMVEGLG